MKKSTIGLIAIAVVCVAGIVYVVSSGTLNPSSVPANTGSSASSDASISSGTSSQTTSSQEDASAVSSAVPTEQLEQSIQSQLKLDWEKYRLTENSTNPVELDGKDYRTFILWDDDYQVGPQILVDPDDGKLYTYVAAVDQKPVELSKDEAFDGKEKAFTGTVEDGAMMSILVKTDDGTKLTIRRLGIELKNLDNGFKIGNKVKVTYTGVIQGDSMERAFVTKIEGL